MTLSIQQINAFGTIVPRGQSVTIAFDHHFDFAPYEDMAAYVLTLRLDMDGQVHLRQETTSREDLLFKRSRPGELLATEIRAGVDYPLSRWLGVCNGRIFHRTAAPTISFHQQVWAEVGLSLDLSWSPGERHHIVETTAPTNVLDLAWWRERLLALGKR